MKRLIFPLMFAVLAIGIDAQNRAVKPRQKAPATRSNAEKAVVIDERLAVLRTAPSLYARPLKRLRRGGLVTLIDVKTADDVVFYRVVASAKTFGWIQRDAVARRSSKVDDERLARLVLASEGFERVVRAEIYLTNYPKSPFRPSILLFVGDILEETALKLSGDATKRLKRREMAASGAPLHSFYLNYVGLDRYRKLGIGFMFNSNTRRFHYDGAHWREILQKSAASNEAVEAQKRLDSLRQKMEETR